MNIEISLRSTYEHIVGKNPTHENWIKFVNLDFVQKSCSLFGFDPQNLELVFDKPIETKPSREDEFDDDGNPLIQSEFTLNSKFDVNQLKDFGWLTDENFRNLILSGENFRNSVIRSQKNDGYSEKVMDEIQRNSIHILGRCNNPNNWGQNKQGLVFGMVQSGKTASMISLMGLAREAGYNLVIVLSGDKDSLRNQTQKRIDDTFSELYNQKFKSLTDSRNDYGKIKKNKSTLDVWNTIEKKPTYLVCIKKEQSNLTNLLHDIKELIQMNSKDYFDFDIWEHFKTLIIDDEADYASQDSNSKKGTSVHKTLVEIRDTIPLNTYVAYTATPQACIGADPKKDIGYPRDFIWLIDPSRDEFGYSNSYLGLEEYFVHYPEFITSVISDDSWAHYKKDDKGFKLGLYDPSTGALNDKKLADAEFNFVNDLVNAKDAYLKTEEFQVAIVDFIIGAAIRWFRYYKNLKANNEFFQDRLPEIAEIEAIENPGKTTTKFGFKPFPYHAMMVNLSQMNKTQSEILKLFELLSIHIFEQYSQNGITAPIFEKQVYKQLIKSQKLNKSIIPDRKELEYFIKVAIEICKKDIFGTGKFIYLLNSNDEGSTLNYDTPDQKVRPKKAAIFVGGLILSRGLTIENLSVSVYCRSQVLSLGDTNLQMCRWFGHKKSYIDLVTLYYQSHNEELFSNIAIADKELRDQFWYNIKNSIKPECILLSLYNSPLFRSTSPQKSRFLGKSKNSSFSGITVDLLEPYNDKKTIENYSILYDFLINQANYETYEYLHNKASVFKNIPAVKFKEFLKSLKVDDKAVNFTPKRYLNYIEKWDNLPEINIAVFGWSYPNNSEFKNIDDFTMKNRARKLYKDDEYSSLVTKDEFEKYYCDKTGNNLARLRGGPSDPNSNERYLGDIFIDKSVLFHFANYEKKPTRREKSMPILFICYLLNPNYIGKKNKDKFFLKKDDCRYIDSKYPVLSFSVSTPTGGPMYEISTNKLITIQSSCYEENNFEEDENI